MKVLFFAFLALAVGANALPYELEGDAENREARVVENTIKRIIQEISDRIRDAGMDPLQIERLRIENTPQPGVVVGLAIDGLTASGGSNIMVHRVNYNAITNRLQMDVSLPAIRMSVVDSSLSLDLHGTKYNARGSGDFTMLSLRVTIDMRLNIGIISGISIRSVEATLRIGSLWSNVNLVINDEDYSELVNETINVTIPEFMRVHQRAIDELLSRIIYVVGNEVLG